MTEADIIALARKHEQYPGSIEPTLRGPGIVEFARALIATHEGERIGNAVPSDAAQAIASEMGRTLLLAWSGETFALSAAPVWVRPALAALSVAQGGTA